MSIDLEHSVQLGSPLLAGALLLLPRFACFLVHANPQPLHWRCICKHPRFTSNPGPTLLNLSWPE